MKETPFQVDASGKPLQKGIAERFPPETLLVLSFAGMILLGTVVLSLPVSTTGGISLIDAFFTATSATCVTGLVVVETGKDFTQFGQGVILVMLQFGGIGIMTFSTFLLYIFGRKMSVRDSALLSKTFGRTRGVSARGLLISVLLVSLVIEAIGAMLLFPRLDEDLPHTDAVWSSIFHSVSAFCNAGFCLFPDSMERYAGNPMMNFALISLVFLGSIGFIAFLEVYQFIKSRLRMMLERLRLVKIKTFVSEPPFRFSIHTKIVLTTSLLLIAVGGAFIVALEGHGAEEGMHWETRIMSALFQSAAARTAGYSTLNIGMMSGATLFLLMVLMFIGASPGSCGGGIKTSTFAVILKMVQAGLRREPVSFFRRRVPQEVQSQAIIIVTLATLVVITGAVLLQIVETYGYSRDASTQAFADLLFEAVSAFGTVGLSTGVTPTLSPLGKLIIIVLMFLGRLGPVTLLVAIARRRSSKRVEYPEGRVIIG